jgi:hypothetical protein
MLKEQIIEQEGEVKTMNEESRKQALETVLTNSEVMELDIPCETCHRKPAWEGIEPISECLECMALKHRETQALVTWDKSKEATLKKVIKFAEKCLEYAENGDYSNGNEAFGSDEGRYLANNYFKQLESELDSLKAGKFPEEK